MYGAVSVCVMAVVIISPEVVLGSSSGVASTERYLIT